MKKDKLKVWTLHLEDMYFVPGLQMMDSKVFRCVVEKREYDKLLFIIDKLTEQRDGILKGLIGDTICGDVETEFKKQEEELEQEIIDAYMKEMDGYISQRKRKLIL